MIVASLLVFAVNLPLFSCACHLWVVSVLHGVCPFISNVWCFSSLV